MWLGSPQRIRFRTKVLAPVVALLVLVTGVALYIVSRTIDRQMHAEAERNLKTADAVFQQSLSIHQRALVARFKNTVNEPRFRAVARLDDEETMSDFLKQALEEYGDGAECFFYFNEQGRLRGSASQHDGQTSDSLAQKVRGPTERALEGESDTGIVTYQQRTFDVVAVPVPTQDRSSIAGVLTVAIQLSAETVNELKALTNTEIAVLADDSVTASTLPLSSVTVALEREANALAATRRGPMTPILIEGTHFLSAAGEFKSGSGGSGFRYLLLSSYEDRLRELNATRLSLIVVSAFSLLAAIVVISVIIRQVTRPLLALRDGAEQAGTGDLTVRVSDIPNDECGDLALAFNGMIANIQQSRGELVQTVQTLQSTEGQLRISTEQLSRIIESARDHMIVTYDPTGRVLSWNSVATMQIGYSQEEAPGLMYSLFFTTEDRALGVPDRLLGETSTGGRSAFEGWRVRRDGSRFWADITLSTLPLADGRMGYVEIARDSTERRETAEAMRIAKDAAEKANRAKSEFLANMSHELRTPMNAIVGMSALLEDRVKGSEETECVHTIRSSANSLLGLIDDILEISRVETGRIELSPHPFDLLACVDAVVDNFAPIGLAKGVAVDSFVVSDVPSVIVGDERRLSQILGVLVGNAVKFTERGSVSLILEYTSSESRPSLRFAIEDTGIGISPDQRERLFKSFSQVDSAHDRRFGGLGVGLAIAHHLVGCMGGTIEVNSSPGQGSIFSFTVAIPPPLESAREFLGLAGRNVCVLAESGVLSRNLEKQLTSWGMRVRWLVGGAADAVRLVGALEAVDSVIFAPRHADNTAVEGLRDVLSESKVAYHGPIFSIPSGEGMHPSALSDSDRICPLRRPLKPRLLHAALKSRMAPVLVSSESLLPLKPALLAHRYPLRILVVEDNPVNSRVALLLLKRLGYSADWVENGRLGLERMKTAAYDLVLMDLQMPEMDGLEATRQFREKVSCDRPPYICALTANALKEDREACKAAGMQQFMAKPVQLPTLTAMLETAARWLETVPPR